MKLGEIIQGGIYIGENLIVTPIYYEKEFPYGCYGAVTGANSESDGYENTQKLILASYGCKSDNMPQAALYCNSLIIDGYDGWYLPSQNELHHMFRMQEYLRHRNAWHWSSSEYALTAAWGQDLSDGYQGNGTKRYSYSCRPIRKLST